MITVYCDPRSRACQQIAEKLDELMIDHRMIEVSDRAPSQLAGCRGQTPAMVDDDRTYCGLEEVKKHLYELETVAGRRQNPRSNLCGHGHDEDESLRE